MNCALPTIHYKSLIRNGVPSGIRTRVLALKGPLRGRIQSEQTQRVANDCNDLTSPRPSFRYIAIFRSDYLEGSQEGSHGS
jgi:hypothetical protein